MPAEPNLSGTVLIFGRAFDLELIAVHLRDGHLQEPLFDPRGRFNELCAFDRRGPFQPVEVPGRTGSFVALAARPATRPPSPGIPDLVVEDLHRIEDEPNYLGRVRLFGVDHHLDLIAIERRGGMLVPWMDPHDRLGPLRRLAAPAHPPTVRVTGLAGDYVAAVTPHCLT